MRSRKHLLVRLCVVSMALVVAGLAACGPSEEEVKTAARVEEYAALQAEHDNLLARRQELAKLRAAEAAAAAEGEASDAEPAEDAPPSPADNLKKEVDAQADAFAERLVNFINEHAGFEGEEPLPEVAGAIRLKSSEDLVLAEEFVVLGGDYAKAIEIVQGALAVDADNTELKSKLEELERLRYMDEDRWSQVEKGMTEDEVRAALGQVKHQNVRQYEDQGITAWFYPREGGAAAAVFFRKRGGVLKVYDLNFEAVKTAAERAEE